VRNSAVLADCIDRISTPSFLFVTVLTVVNFITIPPFFLVNPVLDSALSTGADGSHTDRRGSDFQVFATELRRHFQDRGGIKR